MMNKKAQGLSINAIILIILGVAVLVVLIAGFFLGWDKVMPFFGEKNNVKTVVGACETACSTSSLYDYCSVHRDLKTEDGKFQNVTCYTLSTISEVFTKYGINKCPSLDCSTSVICRDWKYVGTDKKSVSISEVYPGKYNTPVYCTEGVPTPL